MAAARCRLLVRDRAELVEGIASWQTEPAVIDACQFAQAVHFPLTADFLFAGEAPPHEEVKVTEAPGDEAEACDAEEGVENLRGDFDPDAAGGVDVVAAVEVVLGGVLRAHCGRGVEKDQEEHAAPGDDVEAVEGDEEAEGGQEPFPEGEEADLGRLCPGLFRGLDVAVREGLLGLDAWGRCAGE